MAEFIRIVENNKDKILAELPSAIEAALMAAGAQAEDHCKMYETAVYTGRLQNSITHAMESEDTVAIGTNVEYAPYVEFGTGKFAERGSKAKKIPWRYQDEEGNWHITSGMKPVHFMEKGIMNHKKEYGEIIKRTLEGF